MNRIVTLLICSLTLLLAACQAQAPDTSALEQRLAALEAQTGSAEMPDMSGVETRLAALEAQLSAMADTPAAEMPDASAMEQRLAALEAQVSAMGATGDAPAPAGDAIASQTYQVVLTTYELDNAGLHGMDEAINGGEGIDPGFLGRVTRVNRLLVVTPWPEALQAQADGLHTTLGAFAEALEADDADAAGPLATEAHEVQHDFSHAVGEWLTANGMAEGGDQ